jgi:hypothetical protein
MGLGCGLEDQGIGVQLQGGTDIYLFSILIVSFLIISVYVYVLFTRISVTSVITEHASQCQVTQKACGTVSTWVQYILYLFQLKYITFWIMVSNYLQINIPGLNRILRYTEH